MLATKRRRPELFSPPPLWLPPKRKPLRWNPACPVHGLAKRCQTQGGKIRTVDGTVPVGEEATCCCGGPEDDCQRCQSGTAPARVLVEISGVTNITCSDCSGFNGTFVLDFIHQGLLAGTYRCVWSYDRGSDGPCSERYLAFWLYLAGIPANDMWMSVGWGTSHAPEVVSPILSWVSEEVTDSGDTIDCATIDNDISPFFSWGGCNNSSSTCHVTAL